MVKIKICDREKTVGQEMSEKLRKHVRSKLSLTETADLMKIYQTQRVYNDGDIFSLQQ